MRRCTLSKMAVWSQAGSQRSALRHSTRWPLRTALSAATSVALTLWWVPHLHSTMYVAYHKQCCDQCSLVQDPPVCPPQQGTKLHVRWSDGQTYSTRVLGQHSAPLYTVSHTTHITAHLQAHHCCRCSAVVDKRSSCQTNTSTLPERSYQNPCGVR